MKPYGNDLIGANGDYCRREWRGHRLTTPTWRRTLRANKRARRAADRREMLADRDGTRAGCESATGPQAGR